MKEFSDENSFECRTFRTPAERGILSKSSFCPFIPTPLYRIVNFFDKRDDYLFHIFLKNLNFFGFF